MSRFIDMALDDEDKLDAIKPLPVSDMPDYPYGLRISLTEKELAKLGVDDDFDVGETIDLRGLGKVTSVSRHDTSEGACCRIEIQIEQLAVESEDREDIGEEKPTRKMSYAHSRNR